MSSTISTSRPGDHGVEVLEDAHDARGVRRGPIGGDRHEVDLHGHLDRAHQVGEEEDRPLQHTDQQQRAVGVVARDLLAERAHARAQLILADEHLADARGRADRHLRDGHCLLEGVHSQGV